MNALEKAATASQLRTAPEPLTIAYIAIGAVAAWEAAGDLPSHIVDGFGGQLGYVDEAVSHAPMLDRLADENEDSGAVFAYDVAEVFGRRIGAWLLADGAVSDADAEIVARQIFAELD